MLKKIEKISIFCLLTWRYDSNSPCLEHVFMVPKLFEPLKFDGIIRYYSTLIKVLPKSLSLSLSLPKSLSLSLSLSPTRFHIMTPMPVFILKYISQNFVENREKNSAVIFTSSIDI